MPIVRFTPHLSRFFPGLAETRVPGRSVAEAIRALEQRHPGISGYLTEDHGALRKHVNVFVNSSPVADRGTLSDAVGDDDELFILQALSGG
jgi:hypothetical protein